MGQHIIQTYIGSYIEVENFTQQEFEDRLTSINFWDNEFDNTPELLCQDKFYRPSDGLLDKPIFLPRPDLGDFCYTLGGRVPDSKEETIVETDFSLLKKGEEEIKRVYKNDLLILSNLFGNNVKVKSGYIHYWDEIA